MKFTDDELVILMIYAEETRGKTIESIRGMIYRTAIDETELREMGNSAIRKLEQMTEEQKERYKLDQEKADFEAQKAKFAHDQLVVETQKQMISAGLPDLAAYITGTTAEETTANLAAVTKLLSTWKAEQLNKAMRGKVPTDIKPQDGTITREQLKKMSREEINAAFNAGKIDLSKL